MPRPAKRTRLSRLSAKQSALARETVRTCEIATDWEIPDSGVSERELLEEEVDSSSDSEEEITVSEPEVSDQSDREWESYPEAGVSHAVGIKQPAKGWKEVERTLERQSSLGIIINRKKNKKKKTPAAVSYTYSGMIIFHVVIYYHSDASLIRKLFSVNNPCNLVQNGVSATKNPSTLDPYSRTTTPLNRNWKASSSSPHAPL